VDPANPTALDLVRLRYTAAVCTSADSVKLSQQANGITVQADRTFGVDCGTVAGLYEEYTLGRLPCGDYDARDAGGFGFRGKYPVGQATPSHFLTRASKVPKTNARPSSREGVCSFDALGGRYEQTHD
jgi:hypothetical protein